MKLSKRIEELAGRLQQRSVEASYSRSDQERTLGLVFEELGNMLFEFSTDLEHDENEAADYRERA